MHESYVGASGTFTTAAAGGEPIYLSAPLGFQHQYKETSKHE